MKNNKLKVAVTGITSCTGSEVAKIFNHNGWEVFGAASSEKASYSELKKDRLNSLNREIEVSYSIVSEDSSMIDWIKKTAPDLFIFHFHYMKDFRSEDYNIQKARKVSCAPCREIMETLVRSGCKGLIYSGTFFEQGEGGKDPSTPITKYALSKAEVWNEIKKWAEVLKLPVSKIVIPNPFGPRENADRLIPLIVRHAVKGEPLKLNNPIFTNDNIPTVDLAQVYLRAGIQLVEKKESAVYRPSGWVTDIQGFCKEVNKSLLQQRLNISPCVLDCSSGNPTKSGISNTDPVTLSLEDTWDGYAAWLKDNDKLALYTQTT